MDEYNDSILNSVKSVIGPAEDYDAFDDSLIVYINSAFGELYQLGVGSSDEFYITGADEKWSDFVDEGTYNMVKSYVIKKVQLNFDPPSSSFVLAAVEKEIEKLEWRLTVQQELDV